jgi:TonB family protein
MRKKLSAPPDPVSEPVDLDLARELEARELHPHLLAQLRTLQDWALEAKVREVEEARRAELRARIPGLREPAAEAAAPGPDAWPEPEPGPVVVVAAPEWDLAEEPERASAAAPESPEHLSAPSAGHAPAAGSLPAAEQQDASAPARDQHSAASRELPMPAPEHLSARGFAGPAEPRRAPPPPPHLATIPVVLPSRRRPPARRGAVAAAGLALLLLLGLAWAMASRASHPAFPRAPALPAQAAPAAAAARQPARQPPAAVPARPGASRPAAAALSSRPVPVAESRSAPVVSAPIPVRIPSYPYPAAARGQGLRAELKVEVLVDENGQVIRALPLTRDLSGMGFEPIALAAARRTRFQPATRDGVRVKMWTDLTFEFAE